ncbi:MAG: hypothetical protein ACYSYV_09920 [Planctomycetota bacterium]
MANLKKQSQSETRQKAKVQRQKGWNSGEIEDEFDAYLKKQSQFVAGQMNVSVLQRKDYENKAHGGHRENKPQQSQMPAVGWKSEALRAYANDRPPPLVILNAAQRSEESLSHWPRFFGFASE